MRSRSLAPIAALFISLAFAPPALAQNLPSELEERLGVPPNAKNPDRGGRPLPSTSSSRCGGKPMDASVTTMTTMRDDERRRYRPARQYNRYPHYSYPY